MGTVQNMLPVQGLPSQQQTAPQGAPQQPQQPAQPPLPPISVDQLNQEHDGLDAMIKRGTPLAANPNLTANDIIEELAGLVSDDHMTAQNAMQTLAALPKSKTGDEVPSYVYQQWMNEKLDRLKHMKMSLTKWYGNPIPKDKHKAIKAQGMAQQQPQGVQ
jgi:hypothetical protein